MLPKNKVIFSGLKPSGDMHLGNYLGALTQWLMLQEHNTAYYCVVDLHAITVPYDSAELSRHVLDTAAMYLALGIDPEKSVLFIQSHVPAHTELAWLLGVMTPYGELTRMTQFKDAYLEKKHNVSLGLFSYPILMAADILLYHADVVPVGEDQLQHIELTRTIADRFNRKFAGLFAVPQPFINTATARIMSLSNPERKMSKSDDAQGCILLMDNPDVIRTKIMRAVTETEPVFSFTNSGPAVRNLLNMYKGLNNIDKQDIEQMFEDKGYKDFKESLADLVISTLRPIQERYTAIRSNESDLKAILERGRQRANIVAAHTLMTVKTVMGLA